MTAAGRVKAVPFHRREGAWTHSCTAGSRRREGARLGDALLDVTGAEHINYEILGNWVPALHAHVAPRYEGEPPERRRAPTWFHDWDEATPFSPNRDQRLIEEIARAIRSRCG